MVWFDMALLAIAAASSATALSLLMAAKTKRYAVKASWKGEGKALFETWHELGRSFDAHGAMKKADRKIGRLTKKLGCCSTLDATKVLFECKYGVWVQVGITKEENDD